MFVPDIFYIQLMIGDEMTKDSANEVKDGNEVLDGDSVSRFVIRLLVILSLKLLLLDYDISLS